MMKVSLSVSGFVLLMALVAAPGAFAEKIEHHGLTVEADGTVRDCVLCHDGSTASHVSYCTVKCDVLTPHAVLKQYPPRGKASEYATVDEIARKGVKIV